MNANISRARQIVFLLLNLLFVLQLQAQVVTHPRLLSFEGSAVPAFVTTTDGAISLSPLHYKDGKSSLKWTFNPKSELVIKKDLHFEPKDSKGKDLYLSTFVIWLYNEKAINDTIRFNFLKDGQLCTSFPVLANFTGWRTAWVCFERDMEGTPLEGMNEIRVQAPDTAGEIFIDHLLTASKTDPRHQTPDVQVPFVNSQTNSHWLVLLRNSLLRPDIALQAAVSFDEKEDIQRIEERFRSLIYKPSPLTEKTLKRLRKTYKSYNILRKDGQITGLPIFFTRATEAYERLYPTWDKNVLERNQMHVKRYFDTMNSVAVAYNNADRAELRDELAQMFLNMYDHINDQGVSYGSCWGNFTHYGYSFRGFYTAYFLMKEVLIQAGKLREAEKAMQWYAMTNEVFLKPAQQGMDMDAFNTQTTGRIASILMMNDSPEKVQYLQSFSRWIDNGCLPAPGLSGAFKRDGGAFHHRNNYPAYAVGGLDGATNMIYLLSRTRFAVSELAHETVKNVLTTMRFYCNKTNFPLSMSGRHPDGKGKIIPIHYATLAVAGTPDGSQDVDPQLAAVYLRLVSTVEMAEKDNPEYMPFVTGNREQEMIDLLTQKGFTPEADPKGNKAVPYACIGVQRRSNWAAVVRGHSRYLWAAEHYIENNYYGRYLAHGSMQLLTAPVGKEVTPLTSGWQEAGFDWGRMPGTTAIHLPIPQLKANVYNVDAFSGIEEMLYSDEAFAGALSQEQCNGSFGMKLHEHDKYNGTHRAHKSYHFFDGHIVCLGSAIENANVDYDTETTLFQLAVTDDKGHDYWKTPIVGKNYRMDHLQTGYYFPVQKPTFEKIYPQSSLGQKTAKETQGDWVSLVINHGKAPKEASYEYVVIPQTSPKELKDFAKKPTYQVLQHDRNAHIVKDKESNTTSYVLFETAQSLPKGLILQVDTTSLLMLREGKDKTVLTVSHPDLALYRGESDELFNENGKRTERSIYSRPWIDNESGVIPVQVTLKGKWSVKGAAECQVISSDNDRTILEFTCHDAASFEVELVK